MNWIDAVILVVWGITAIWGFAAGLLQVVLPLCVTIAGLALSSRFAEDVGNLFSRLTDSEDIQTIAGFILIFLGLFIVGLVAGFCLRKVLGLIPLFGLVNRLGGIAAAILVGFLLLSGLLTAVQQHPFQNMDERIDDSALGSFLADNFDVVIRGAKLIPGDWDDRLGKLVN